MTREEMEAEVGRLLTEERRLRRLGLSLPPDKRMLLARLLYRLGWTKMTRMSRRQAVLRYTVGENTPSPTGSDGTPTGPEESRSPSDLPPPPNTPEAGHNGDSPAAEDWDGTIDEDEVMEDEELYRENAAEWSRWTDGGEHMPQAMHIQSGLFTPPGRDTPVPVYRWVHHDHDGDHVDSGEWDLVPEDVERRARRYADRNDESPPDPEDSDIPGDVSGTSWRRRQGIATYHSGGYDNEVRLDTGSFEFAGQDHDVYRWTTENDSDGDWTLDRGSAIAEGRDYANDNHEEPSDDQIHPYDYKPPWESIGEKGPYYGAELETQLKESSSLSLEEAAEKTLDILNQGYDYEEFAFLKEDSSIERDSPHTGKGTFEIVTHPATLDVHRKQWVPFFADVPKGLISHDARAGLHIHVGRDDLSNSKLHIGKMVAFINALGNKDFLTKLARRESPQWAKLDPDKKVTDVEYWHDRYVALNLKPSKTIEFRLFRGTLKPESFFTAMEFVDALVNISRPGMAGVKEMASPDALIRYVVASHKDYPHLLNFVERYAGQRFVKRGPKSNTPRQAPPPASGETGEAGGEAPRQMARYAAGYMRLGARQRVPVAMSVRLRFWKSGGMARSAANSPRKMTRLPRKAIKMARPPKAPPTRPILPKKSVRVMGSGTVRKYAKVDGHEPSQLANELVNRWRGFTSTVNAPYPSHHKAMSDEEQDQWNGRLKEHGLHQPDIHDLAAVVAGSKPAAWMSEMTMNHPVAKEIMQIGQANGIEMHPGPQSSTRSTHLVGRKESVSKVVNAIKSGGEREFGAALGYHPDSTEEFINRTGRSKHHLPAPGKRTLIQRVKGVLGMKKKGLPIKMAKVDGHEPAHPLISGFPIEHALRHLANDPKNNNNIRDMAYIALTGKNRNTGEVHPQGHTEALWLLNDALQEANHPLAKVYNWMSAADKVQLDGHTHTALTELANHTRSSHGVPASDTRWNYRPEGQAHRVVLGLYGKKPSGVDATVHRHIKEILSWVKNRVKQLAPHADDKMIEESVRRHAHRATMMWRRDHGIPTDSDELDARMPVSDTVHNNEWDRQDHANRKATRYTRLTIKPGEPLMGGADFMHEIHDESGQRIGHLWISPMENGTRLHVNHVGAMGHEPNSLGLAAVRDAKRQLKALYPNARRITGTRISGASQANTGQPRPVDMRLKRKLPPKRYAVNALVPVGNRTPIPEYVSPSDSQGATLADVLDNIHHWHARMILVYQQLAKEAHEGGNSYSARIANEYEDEHRLYKAKTRHAMKEAGRPWPNWALDNEGEPVPYDEDFDLGERNVNLKTKRQPKGETPTENSLKSLMSRKPHPKRYALSNRSDFLSALRRIRSSNQKAMHKTADQLAQQLGLHPVKVLDALHDTPHASVPGIAQAVYGNVRPEAIHAAAAWVGLTSNLPGVAVFHPRPTGPDTLYRFRMEGSGMDARAKMDRFGLRSRILVPHRKGFDVLIPDKGNKLLDRVEGFADHHKINLEASPGHFALIGDADQARAREMFRGTVAKQEKMSRTGKPKKYNMSHTHEDFHNKIAENMEDKTAHLVYADWLQDQGLEHTANFIRDSLTRGEEPTYYPRDDYGKVPDIPFLNTARDADHKEGHVFAIGLRLPNSKRILSYYRTGLSPHESKKILANLKLEGVV